MHSFANEEPLGQKRLQGETSRAYRAFCFYCDLGPSRSLDRAWGCFCKSSDPGKAHVSSRRPGHWALWCQKFHWVERAGAYDEIVDKQRRRAFAERYRKLQDMRSRFEIDDQPRFEKLVQNIDSVLQRAGTAPLSEVTQVKYDKVTGKKTTTKIRSVDMPGIAALAKARIQVARQAALRAEPKMWNGKSESLTTSNGWGRTLVCATIHRPTQEIHRSLPLTPIWETRN